MFGSFLPSLVGWLCYHQPYSGVGADIVMESITPIDRVLSVIGLISPVTTALVAWQRVYSASELSSGAHPGATLRQRGSPAQNQKVLRAVLAGNRRRFSQSCALS